MRHNYALEHALYKIIFLIIVPKMDGPAQENSDSDSGDSWTLLDNPTNDTAVLNDKVKV